MSFVIIKLRKTYADDLQGLAKPVIMSEKTDSFGFPCPLEFESGEQAYTKVAELDDEPYCTNGNEAGRPDYYVLEDQLADQIVAMSNDEYQWESFNGDCNACCECQNCFDFMHNEQRKLVRQNAV